MQQAFVPIWVEYKMLALTVGDRPNPCQKLTSLVPGSISMGALVN